jgi:hypothetical protein
MVVVVIFILIMRSRTARHKIILLFFVFAICIPIYHLIYVICFDDIE